LKCTDDERRWRADLFALFQIEVSSRLSRHYRQRNRGKEKISSRPSTSISRLGFCRRPVSYCERGKECHIYLHLSQLSTNFHVLTLHGNLNSRLAIRSGTIPMRYTSMYSICTQGIIQSDVVIKLMRDTFCV